MLCQTSMRGAQYLGRDAPLCVCTSLWSGDSGRAEHRQDHLPRDLPQWYGWDFSGQSNHLTGMQGHENGRGLCERLSLCRFQPLLSLDIYKFPEQVEACWAAGRRRLRVPQQSDTDYFYVQQRQALQNWFGYSISVGCNLGD